MNFNELVHTRYSVRSYKPDPVPDELLNKVLEAAVLAPTASNRQPFRIIVIHTKNREVEFNHVYHREWFVEAPLILAVVGLVDQAWVRSFDSFNSVEVDAGIIMDHIVMAATDLGLGTCWVANFDPAAAREALHLPPEAEPLLFTPLGFPAAQPARERKRKDLTELVRYEKW
jgi:nitroreductase